MAKHTGFILCERIPIFAGILWLLAFRFYQYIAVIFRQNSTTRSYRHEVRNRLTHAFKLIGDTETTCRRVCEERKSPWKTEDVPGGYGAKIHWIGDTTAGNLIFYIHGGGFGLPADTGHPKFLLDCQARLSLQRKHIVIAFLEYGLTPETRYPTQSIQALVALQVVLDKGFHPSKIVIGGDSAGGNLALSMLSFINHPTETVPEVKLEAPLRGVILISPWVSFGAQSQSFRKFEDRDIVLKRQMLEWADTYASSPIRNEYSEPIRADSSWWENLPVEEVLILAGSIEVFRDDIEFIGRKLSHAGVQTKAVTCENHIHIECILDALTGLAPGSMANEVWDWLDSRF